MWFLRLAISWHKLFQAQFWFGTKVKTSHKTILQRTWSFDLTEKRGSQQSILVFGPSQKWFKFPPTFFKVFINFLVVCHLLLNIQKYLLSRFSVSVRYDPFWLWTWSKIKNFEFFHKIENDYLIKTNDLYFIVKVKSFNFWLSPKSK